jgi:hypothetical protein
MQSHQEFAIEQMKALTAMAQFAAEFAKAETARIELAKAQLLRLPSPSTASNHTEETNVSAPHWKWLGSLEDAAKWSIEMVEWARKHSSSSKTQSLPFICREIPSGEDAWLFVDKWLMQMVSRGHVSETFISGTGKIYYWRADLSVLYGADLKPKMAWEF